MAENTRTFKFKAPKDYGKG